MFFVVFSQQLMSMQAPDGEWRECHAEYSLGMLSAVLTTSEFDADDVSDQRDIVPVGKMEKVRE